MACGNDVRCQGDLEPTISTELVVVFLRPQQATEAGEVVVGTEAMVKTPVLDVVTSIVARAPVVGRYSAF